MQRFIASLVVVFMIVTMSMPAFGQARRYRINTQTGSLDRPTPSFRGGEQGVVAPASQQPYGVQPRMVMPRMMPGQPGGMGTPSMALGYQIHVLGEVFQPGTYKIPASGRLADAIKRAGGFAGSGSDRRIELKRNGRIIQTVDFLKYQLLGNLADNPYLQDNDVVFVPLRKNVIRVVGAVRRPETYELRNEKTLGQVIRLAGGFNAATATDEMLRVIRFEGGEKQVKEVANNTQAMKKFKILSGDVVVVPNVVTKETEFDYNIASIPGDQVFYPSYEDRVFVLGGVQIPGAYPFSPYYTVNQYISLAGGLNDRGKERYRIIDVNGKSRKAAESDRVNPGDTVMIKQRWMSPAGWMGFALGIASFGLAVSSTAIALSR